MAVSVVGEPWIRGALHVVLDRSQARPALRRRRHVPGPAVHHEIGQGRAVAGRLTRHSHGSRTSMRPVAGGGAENERAAPLHHRQR